MPSPHQPSQPERQVPAWLASRPGRQLLEDVQRAALPEVTRVFGQIGLYLRPSESMPAELSGNMLTSIISLWLDGPPRLSGAFSCLAGELPISSASLSLIYSLFVLEASDDPASTLAEFARVLKPEGFVLVIAANPWSPAQFRWLKPPLALGAPKLERLASDVGLEVARRHCFGPFWPDDNGSTAELGSGWLDGFRAATLTVLRRREAALTPLRKAPSTVSLRPGMSAG